LKCKLRDIVTTRNATGAPESTNLVRVDSKGSRMHIDDRSSPTILFVDGILTECSNSFLFLVLTFSVSLLASAGEAQGPMRAEPSSATEGFSAVQTPRVETQPHHKFWDKHNRILFVANTTLSAADFGVTRSNLQDGGRELNPFARAMGSSTPALALNFAGEVAGTVAISYLFHKAGHHKLERITSCVNIGASAAAVSYGFVHR